MTCQNVVGESSETRLLPINTLKLLHCYIVHVVLADNVMHMFLKFNLSGSLLVQFLSFTHSCIQEMNT